MPDDPARLRLIERLRAEMTRATGRRYERLDLAALDVDSLRELERFLRDLDAEHRAALDRARMLPWRRG